MPSGCAASGDWSARGTEACGTRKPTAASQAVGGNAAERFSNRRSRKRMLERVALLTTRSLKKLSIRSDCVERFPESSDTTGSLPCRPKSECGNGASFPKPAKSNCTVGRNNVATTAKRSAVFPNTALCSPSDDSYLARSPFRSFAHRRPKNDFGCP